MSLVKLLFGFSLPNLSPSKFDFPSLIKLHTTKKKNCYCSGFFAVGSKNVAICHILRHFVDLPLCMIHIATYSLSVTIDIVFCDALQQRYKKPLQYICFSDVCLSYSGGIPNCHNRLLFAASFLRYSSRLSDCHNRIFNCWRALVLFFPFFVPFPTPKLITLVPYLFIFLTHLSPSKGKKKKKNSITLTLKIDLFLIYWSSCHL